MSINPVIKVRQALWLHLYGEIPSAAEMTDPVLIAHARERLEAFVTRFGEDRVLAKLRTRPGMDTITMELARQFLNRNWVVS